MYKKITYSQVGDNYTTKDPVKLLAQKAARQTARNLSTSEFQEITATRGESAFVWQQGRYYMASVVEGLGTKNLIADAMRKITKKTYYDTIAHDTVASIINDLISVGAKPLTLQAYWAIEDNTWFADSLRLHDFLSGWQAACNDAGVTWGGGETATLKGLITPDCIELGGSAVGIITSKKRLILDTKLKKNDRIILLKSTGVNANGISLTRAIAERLPHGYNTLMGSGEVYGKVLLKKSNIYAKLINDLLTKGIDIHYLSYITGHGMRKVMRSNRSFTYMLKNIFKPQEIFSFIQKHANVSDKEMYETYNMGMDYAIFLPSSQVKKTLRIITTHGYEAIDAGYIQEGKRQVVIEPKNLILEDATLKLK